MSHAEEFAVAFSHATPTARKHHRCSACSETIEPGTRYHKYGSVYDGTACTTKQCERCRAIFEALCARTRDPILLDLDCGEVWEDVFGPCPPEVAALAFALPGDA